MSHQLSLSRDQVREIDRTAIEQIGIPGVVLMENAGRNTAWATLELLPDPAAARAAIVCGSGNNGGDGFVIARHLHNAGVSVTTLLACEPERIGGDARINYEVIERMSLPIHPIRTSEQLAAQRAVLREADVIVDALLGTGFSGRPRPPLDAAIEAINAASQAKVIAVDVPSGLDCDTGRPSRPCVRADLTVTFVARKTGFDKPAACEHLGRVVVADIGVPVELLGQYAR
ncbi:MAG TPA: NAD(P)H-hydrate epimerase [Phycisphaerae bacterium]|nr:NAD(P)H-hydrate epimerase [Phycisphaerae bacterium]